MSIPFIRVVDPVTLDTLGEIDDYETLRFVRRWQRVGEFELQINRDKQNAETLREGCLIMLDDDMRRAGIIRFANPVEADSVTLGIKGDTLQGFARQRQVYAYSAGGYGYDRVAGYAETVLKHFARHLADGAKRAIPHLRIAEDKRRGMTTPWQARFESLDEVLRGVAEWCDIGWEIALDMFPKALIFDVIPGIDRSRQQTEISPVVFSVEYENLASLSHTIDRRNYSSMAYALGSGEEEDQLVLEVGGDAAGFERFERNISCGNVEDAQELADEGARRLREYQRVESLTGETLQSESFVYRRDYDLGDRVTVESEKLGLEMHPRIVEIVETYGGQELKVNAVFGDAPVTLGDILRRIEKER